MIDLKTRAVAPFPPDARTFHNIYKLQKHVLSRHQSYMIVYIGNKNLRFWQIMHLLDKMDQVCDPPSFFLFARYTQYKLTMVCIIEQTNQSIDTLGEYNARNDVNTNLQRTC